VRPSPTVGRSSRRPGLNQPAIFLGCAVLVFVCLFPFLWMGLSSIKLLNELYTIPPQWWPDHPTLANYYKVLFESRIPRYFLNSIIISVGSTGLALILAVFAANGFARFRFKGRSFWQACILVGQLLPTAAIIVPLFITLRVLGLVNTYWGLILVYMIITLPLAVWMLTSYFRAIPVELEEAAIIDGAGYFTIIRRIVLPLSRPALATVAVIVFVGIWNEFFFANLLSASSETQNAQVALSSFRSQFNFNVSAMLAGTTVVMMVPIVIFLLLQRQVIAGLTAGTTK
jgi:ABC-type glycerol-3-phosphate transport system permease component